MIKEILSYKPNRKILWSGKYKIPWDEPEFSKRMLKMHLSQEHDMASRREEFIKKQVKWIHNKILKGKCSKILDVGCGPGLYVKSLAKLGHACTGIDFSPASIEYARHNCKEAAFLLKDVRSAEYGEGYDLAMLLFGELNVFSSVECKSIIEKIYGCLNPGGIILIEVHLFDAVKRMGQAPKSWFRSGGVRSGAKHWFDNVMDDGLFSENPHVVLVENNWLEEEHIALSNFWVLEDGKEVSHYASTTQAYTDQEYVRLLERAKFKNSMMHEDFGESLTKEANYQVISAVKK